MARIIPVLDVRRGQVVHAVRGLRAQYRPVRSTLTREISAPGVVRALRRGAAYSRIYCADLDALMGERPQLALWRRLCRMHPDVEFWLDAGAPAPLRLPRNCRRVVGTECLRRGGPPAADAILSLDFDADGLRGLAPCRRLWRREIIVMCLHRVGTGEGPDFPLLRAMRRRHPARQLVCAGGVRDGADLRRLARLRMDALVADALHQGRIRAPRWRAR